MLKWTRNTILADMLCGKGHKAIGRATYLKHDPDGRIYLRHRKVVMVEWPTGPEDYAVLFGGERAQPEKKLLNRFVFEPRMAVSTVDGKYVETPAHDDHIYKQRGVWFIKVGHKHYEFTDGMMLHNGKQLTVSGAPEVPPERPVVFRRWNGLIVALFPTEPADARGITCRAYTHGMGAGSADFEKVRHDSEAATPGEYAALHNELITAGYRLKVYTRGSKKQHETRRHRARKGTPVWARERKTHLPGWNFGRA